MIYDKPLRNGSDDYLNSLAEDWSNHDTNYPEVATAESQAEESLPTLPDEGQSVLFGTVPKDEQQAVIRMMIPQAF
jgi:hypothetical protein